MAYASTIGGGQFTSTKNIPRNIYTAPDIIKSLWKPVPVTKYTTFLYEYVDKRFADIAKSSAQHIKEGLIYESRGAILNNPLHPVEISGWGMLNNLSGAGVGTMNAAKTPTSRATRNNKLRSRDQLFETKMTDMKNAVDAAIVSAIGPEPIKPQPGAGRMKDYHEELKRWKARRDAFVSKGENKHLKPISEDFTKYRKGHQNLLTIFKRGGYFIAPKLATLELRFDNKLYTMGKGEDYIELDGLIYDKKHNKFLILELKKEKGATGMEDAQQLRKAAALFRKWGLEILGRVPTVELYFAAGAAESFADAKMFEFGQETNAVQNWTPRHIQTMVERSSNHILYIRTPVFLLTGVGFADLLRIDPDKIAQIRSALTIAARDLDRISEFFIDKKLIDPVMREWAVKENGGTKEDPEYAKAEPEDFGKEGPQLYLDIGRMAIEHPVISKLVPKWWAPQAAVILPTMKLARIAEGILYINALKRKMAKPGINAAKKAQLEKEYKNYHKLLLSKKYVSFIKPAERNKLTAELARISSSPIRSVVASPEQTAKYYSRVLKQGGLRQTTYFKRNENVGKPGVFKQAPSRNVKFGYKKVAAEEVLPNYLFKKGVNVNFGNVTKNNVASLNNSTIIRWLAVITRNLTNPKIVLTNNKAEMYRKILEGILESRPENNNRIKALSPTKQEKAQKMRSKIVKNARNSINLIEGKLALMGRGRKPSVRGNASSKPSAPKPSAPKPSAPKPSAPQNKGNNVVGKIVQQIKTKFPNTWKNYIPVGPRSVAKYAGTYGTNVQGLYNRMQNPNFQYKPRQ